MIISERVPQNKITESFELPFLGLSPSGRVLLLNHLSDGKVSGIIVHGNTNDPNDLIGIPVTYNVGQITKFTGTLTIKNKA